MGRFCVPRVKTVIGVLVVLGLIAYIVRCYYVKQKSDNCALVEVIKYGNAESFENFKYCIRPMFAVDGVMAMKLWRREVCKLISQCSDALEEYNYANNELKSSVREFIRSLEQVEICMLYWNMDDRERLRQILRMVDKRYESFSRVAERSECFVEKIAYCDEYR